MWEHREQDIHEGDDIKKRKKCEYVEIIFQQFCWIGSTLKYSIKEGLLSLLC